MVWNPPLLSVRLHFPVIFRSSTIKKVFKSSRFPVHLNWVLFPHLVIERYCCLSKESIRKLFLTTLAWWRSLARSGWMDGWIQFKADTFETPKDGNSTYRTETSVYSELSPWPWVKRPTVRGPIIRYWNEIDQEKQNKTVARWKLITTETWPRFSLLI